jgi:alpha-methylacyl-CoA racemase
VRRSVELRSTSAVGSSKRLGPMHSPRSDVAVERSGPLSGLKVLEFSGIGPGPYCGMLLADMGADVVIIDRADGEDPAPVVARGKASLELDLKQPKDRDVALAALALCDVLIEGFRPGVMERLGLGPDVACGINPRLIYARMTGWGQDGPLARTAGHDIDYIAVAGALELMGPPDQPPWPPLNLVGDFGGGSLFLVLGVCAALYERERSGRGQVIDAAIIDGVASLMASAHGGRVSGWFPPGRGNSVLGGMAPHYRAYRCRDGEFIAVGAVEARFYAEFVAGLGFELSSLPDRDDPANWPDLAARFAARIAERTRDEWILAYEGGDACVSPVLSLNEAAGHPHNRVREVFIIRDGVVQAAPAPRLSRTPGARGGPEPRKGEGGLERLRCWGLSV